MKIPLLLALAGLAIGFTPPVFAQQKDTVDPETAQQVRALASNYDAAFNRQDESPLPGPMLRTRFLIHQKEHFRVGRQ